MSLLSRLREKQSGKFATATPATFATLEGGKGRTVATVATVTVANPANEQFADAVIYLPTPGDPLAHLAELDSLIVHLAELEAWPPCEFRAKLDTDSAANWTVIPAQTGHGFRGKLDS
jgi:hypothetical protein